MRNAAVSREGRSSGRVAAVIATNGGTTNNPAASRMAAYSHTGVTIGRRPSNATRYGRRSARSGTQSVPTAAKITTDTTRTAIADSDGTARSRTPATSSGTVAIYAAVGA